jgi:hypothetical protein
LFVLKINYVQILATNIFGLMESLVVIRNTWENVMFTIDKMCTLLENNNKDKSRKVDV